MSQEHREQLAELLGEFRLMCESKPGNAYAWMITKLDALYSSGDAGRDERYYWPDGSLQWTHAIDVGHLIEQLKTLDPKMKVSSVTFIETKDGTKARAYGLSMSRERWDEGGWLDFKREGPECLAIWASQVRELEGVNGEVLAVKPLTETVCKECGLRREEHDDPKQFITAKPTEPVERKGERRIRFRPDLMRERLALIDSSSKDERTEDRRKVSPRYDTDAETVPHRRMNLEDRRKYDIESEPRYNSQDQRTATEDRRKSKPTCATCNGTGWGPWQQGEWSATSECYRRYREKCPDCQSKPTTEEPKR